MNWEQFWPMFGAVTPVLLTLLIMHLDNRNKAAKQTGDLVDAVASTSAAIIRLSHKMRKNARQLRRHDQRVRRLQTVIEPRATRRAVPAGAKSR